MENEKMKLIDLNEGSITGKFNLSREDELNKMVEMIAEIGNREHRAKCDHKTCTGTFPYVEEAMKDFFVKVEGLGELDRMAIVASIYYAAGVDAGHIMGSRGISLKGMQEIQGTMIDLKELKDIALGRRDKDGNIIK